MAGIDEIPNDLFEILKMYEVFDILSSPGSQVEIAANMFLWDFIYAVGIIKYPSGAISGGWWQRKRQMDCLDNNIIIKKNMNKQVREENTLALYRYFNNIFGEKLQYVLTSKYSVVIPSIDAKIGSVDGVHSLSEFEDFMLVANHNPYTFHEAVPQLQWVRCNSIVGKKLEGFDVNGLANSELSVIQRVVRVGEKFKIIFKQENQQKKIIINDLCKVDPPVNLKLKLPMPKEEKLKYSCQNEIPLTQNHRKDIIRGVYDCILSRFSHQLSLHSLTEKPLTIALMHLVSYDPSIIQSSSSCSDRLLALLNEAVHAFQWSQANCL